MKTLTGTPGISPVLQASAGNTYTLTVLNENANLQQFTIFKSGPSMDSLVLAWMVGRVAPGTPENPAQISFQWTDNLSATTGYIQELNGRSLIMARSFVGIGLDNQNSLNVTYNGSFPNGIPLFPNGPVDGRAGVILVQADQTIPTSAQQASERQSINVGIALDGKPTMAIQLLPSMLYEIAPPPNYYIVAGSFLQGQVINISTLSNSFEFEYQGVSKRTIIYTEENQFKNDY